MADAIIIEHFQIESALRGYHMYRNTENWTPVKGQQLTFHRELHNFFYYYFFFINFI